ADRRGGAHHAPRQVHRGKTPGAGVAGVNTPQREDRPAPRSAALEQNGDELTLTLRPVGFRKGTDLASLVGLVVLACALIVLVAGGVIGRILARRTDLSPPPEAVVSVALYESLFLVLIFHLLYKAFRKPVFTVTREEFSLSYRGFLPFRGWHLPRSGISGIGAWKGLWVVARGKPYRLLTERNADELLWVAAALRKALGVPERKPATPHHIPPPINPTTI